MASDSAAPNSVDSPPCRSLSLQTESSPPKSQRRDEYGCSYDGYEDPGNGIRVNASDPEERDDHLSKSPASLPTSLGITAAEAIAYEEAVKKSDGFGGEIGDVKAIVDGGLFTLSSESFRDKKPLAKAAIKHFSKRIGKKFKAGRVVGVTCRISYGKQYNITFRAKNPDNGSIETFRAIVIKGSLNSSRREVVYCDRHPNGYLDDPFPWSWVRPYMEF